ncbi:hypothetical protein HY570_01235 [Candidatus Micrarchaeota archaeon]|nr:hypothetical protein [Candidatus Micrarchaeota archaeon]
MADMLERQNQLGSIPKEEEIEREYIRLLRKRGRRNKTRLAKALVYGLGDEESQDICASILLNKDLGGKTAAKELCEIGLKDPGTREISIEILTSLRGAALHFANTALGDSDLEVVNAAKKVLTDIGSLSISSVVKSLEHESRRKAATEVLIELSNFCISRVCSELLTYLRVPKLRTPIFQVFSILGEQALPELSTWLDTDKFDRSSLICLIEKLIREERSAKDLTLVTYHMRPYDQVDQVNPSTERSFPTPMLDTNPKTNDFSPLKPSQTDRPHKPSARLSIDPDSGTWKPCSSMRFSPDSRPLHSLYDSWLVPRIPRWSPTLRK